MANTRSCSATNPSRFRAVSLLAIFVLAIVLLLPWRTEAAPPLPKAKLIAVYAYADWCSNCQLLSPNLAKARKEGKLDDKPVLFVTLDLSDKQRIHQSILLAQALGIGGFLKAQGSSTGYVAVLDAESHKELARFDSASEADTIQTELESLLAGD